MIRTMSGIPNRSSVSKYSLAENFMRLAMSAAGANGVAHRSRHADGIAGSGNPGVHQHAGGTASRTRRDAARGRRARCGGAASPCWTACTTPDA